MQSSLPHSPAAERNRDPILAVLKTLLKTRGHALEIASGTGQHAAYFSNAFPEWTWQPTDRTTQDFNGIEQWAVQSNASNVRTPRVLNVVETCWPSEGTAFETPFDLIYCANMLHISPWATCEGLMQGAARHLSADGLLVTYGPYLEEEVPTAPGNLAFDADLKARNPAWGIRNRADVERQAHQAGLRLSARHALPANNLLLVFQRTG